MKNVSQEPFFNMKWIILHQYKMKEKTNDSQGGQDVGTNKPSTYSQVGIPEMNPPAKEKTELEKLKGNKDQWATPSWIKKIFEGWFDPCTMELDIDGLGSDWYDKTYVNPPYSKPLKWVKKAVEENKKGKMIVMLMRMDTSTEWFKILQEAKAHFFWYNGRIRFNDYKPANFPSMLVVLK